MRNLSLDERATLLVRIIEDDVSHPEAAVRRRAFHEIHTKREGASVYEQRRAAAQILTRADAIMKERRRTEAERAERERMRREHEQAEQRRKHLESLRGRETDLWAKANQLIVAKQPRKYDEAISILQDLRALAEQDGASSAFYQHMERLRIDHAGKPALLQRFRKARLSSQL